MFASVLAALAAAAIAASAAGASGFYMSEHPPTAPERPGVVITVHGGGWEGNYGPGADQLMWAYIDQFRGYGYRVYNLAHRPWRKSVKDMYTAVRRVSRKRPGRPLCLFGGSSGGHLVLLAALEYPELVDCVIDQAGIPDLIKPDTAPAWPEIHRLALRIWGRKRLREVSPMQRARKLTAPVFVTAPECDRTVSVERQRKLVRKLPNATLFVQEAAQLPGGIDGIDTGHCPVTWGSVYEMWRNYAAFLARYAG